MSKGTIYFAKLRTPDRQFHHLQWTNERYCTIMQTKGDTDEQHFQQIDHFLISIINEGIALVPRHHFRKFSHYIDIHQGARWSEYVLLDLSKKLVNLPVEESPGPNELRLDCILDATVHIKKYSPRDRARILQSQYILGQHFY